MGVRGTLGAGPLLRRWREERRLSQLALSAAAGVSTRHLSCVETGRATPSRELLQHLAAELDVPLRHRNDLLLAAGYAPVYPERPLSDPGLRPVADVLAAVIEHSDPNPTIIVDRHGNLVKANAAALWLTVGVADHLLTPPVNVALLLVHPEGLARRIHNFPGYAHQLVRRVRRSAADSRDAALGQLLEDLEHHTADTPHPAEPPSDPPLFAIPLLITVDGHDLALFSTIATFSTAIDVTVAELSMETFYPADDSTAATLAARPWT